VSWSRVEGQLRNPGHFDVVDIVHAADPKEVEKAVMIIRAYRHSTTETLVATPWKEFLDML